MTKIRELHSKNDRIKEQLHALEVSKLFTKKDKLQLGNYYRKIIEKNGIKWIAYDGNQWVHSCKSIHIPKSKPTNKQRQDLRFGLND